MAAPLGRDALPDFWSYGVCRDGRVFFIEWASFIILAIFFFSSLARAPCPLRGSRLAAGCCLCRLAFSNRCLSRLAVIQLTAPLGYIHAPGNLWTRDTWYVQVRHQTGCDLLGRGTEGQKTNNTTQRRLGFFAALFSFHWPFAYIYIYIFCCYRFAERMGRGLHGRWSQLLHQVSSAGAALQRVAARGGRGEKKKKKSWCRRRFLPRGPVLRRSKHM